MRSNNLRPLSSSRSSSSSSSSSTGSTRVVRRIITINQLKAIQFVSTSVLCMLVFLAPTTDTIKASAAAKSAAYRDHVHNYTGLNSYGRFEVVNSSGRSGINRTWSSAALTERFRKFQSFILNEYSPKSNKSVADCSPLFENCLCSFYRDIERNYLYCNHPSVSVIPDFKTIESLVETYIRPTNRKANLVFAKIDFSGSSIHKIHKDDLSHLKLDVFNQNAEHRAGGRGQLLTPKSDYSVVARNVSETTNTFESFLEQLKKVVVPKYHLDFEGIVDIEDAAFERFTTTTHKLLGDGNNNNELLLKIRFADSRFNFSPHRKPFAGIRALEFHINNMSSEYLANSIFDGAVIKEFYLDDAPNFIGFLDMSESLPTGRLVQRFVVTRAYKIDSLCSHSLPSFVDAEQFAEIQIKKCANLRSIKAFTFYRYAHLKTLVLAANNFEFVDKDSFRNLNDLVSLDLSSNPIGVIEDETFRDLNSLKSLYLESTQVKKLGENSLVGLYSLTELKLTKSSQLSEIHGRAFRDSRRSLRELHLKDTQVRLLSTLEKDGTRPPYPQWLDSSSASTVNSTVWPNGLNLTLLNLDSNVVNEEFSSVGLNVGVGVLDARTRSLACKLMRYVPESTLLNLQRNQTCTCLVYLLYRGGKNAAFAAAHPKWEYKAPFCYRDQIGTYANGSRSFEAIRKREVNECELDKMNAYCFPPPTTTTTRTTTTTSTVTITVTISTTTTTTTTRRRSSARTRDPNQTTPKPKNRMPNVNYTKLFQVILVIAILSAISILVTIGAWRFARSLDRRKRMKRQQQAQLVRQQRSSSSSTQTTNNPSIASGRPPKPPERRYVVLPPSVIPTFNPKLPILQSKKASQAVVGGTNSALNQLIAQTTGSQFTGFGQVNLRNPNETNLLLMQDMAYQNQMEHQQQQQQQGPTASFNLSD